MANIGVEVTTSTRSGPSNPGTPHGRFHVAGLTEKGPTAATLLRSLAEYDAVYGGRTAYSNSMFDTARTFWEEGGSELIVSRVVGPAAAKGELALKDQAATPVDTLRAEAVNPGEYSTSYSVEVTANGDTYTVTVYHDGAAITRYANLASPAELVAASAQSNHVRFYDLGSASAAPTNNPAAIAATPLQAGSDDRAAVTTTEVIAALDAAGTDIGSGGAVAAPGYPADTIGADLIAHAQRTSKIALTAMDADATVEDATLAAAALTDTVTDGSYGGMFYPHLVVPDGSGTRTVSPEGYVAGVRARVFNTEGFTQVPAGDRARTRFVQGTNITVPIDVNNTLADGNVNGIVTTGARVRLYNWTSLSADRENMGRLSARDALNGFSRIITEALEPYVFSELDSRGKLLGFVESAVTGVLDPVATRGGLYPRESEGSDGDPGYKVQVDSVNNPLSAAAENEVIVSVAVRLAPTAALIKVEIIKVALTAAA